MFFLLKKTAILPLKGLCWFWGPQSLWVHPPVGVTKGGGGKAMVYIIIHLTAHFLFFYFFIRFFHFDLANC